MDSYDGENPLLREIDDFYSEIRWNNQFKYMGKLPSYLEDQINERKPILEQNDPFDIQEKPLSTALIPLDNTTRDVAGESLLDRYQKLITQEPRKHNPWKLSKVINGHLGWVRCIAMDPVDNEWFATGSNDSTIKVWDFASGKLKLTLSGHVMGVRDLVVSKRHPYMFSASEDKLVKCWDLEKNAPIRDYFGHLSGVHTVDIHPTLSLIASAGRDSVVKLWDIRSKKAVITLVGHKSPINSVKCTPADPQIISCSNDTTVITWDLVAAKPMKVITHHRKAVRDIAVHPGEFSVASCSTNDIRSWKLPEGSLLTNFESQNSGIINTLCVNQDDVLFAGADDGTLSFYDYRSGHKYQSFKTKQMPGSLESERGILSSSFDMTGLRLITGETDKSIKIWKQEFDSEFEELPWNPILSSQRF
ncbi:hypothetical protein KAFR_0H02450 [Kazachstania africana CBS 2517]|uniref:Pre-mRNA-splicing factor PRP46 n=1 Tax=Kazachstania africana (strain ATCC 22294 / BCRC 22015 / CBS 2517 / CECT 1963 / NBRC 1671 / NRRL Y-8276) TaxID=1071382 RepID=H2AZ98_KAZAF|nr:hypothetical protein KAFR_0H02450 [Kazachstania africana CBS 2517]CCF59654.1 hypothetical protein KAFR_0H02450 [Kazachstania africana CBS 2517]